MVGENGTIWCRYFPFLFRISAVSACLTWNGSPAPLSRFDEQDLRSNL
jgi:hypothetical protein